MSEKKIRIKQFAVASAIGRKLVDLGAKIYDYRKLEKEVAEKQQ